MLHFFLWLNNIHFTYPLGNREKLFYGYKVSFGVMKMIWRWVEIILIILAQHLECPKCCWIIPIKMVNLYHILLIKSSSDGSIAWAVMNMCLYVYLYKYLFSRLLDIYVGVELLVYMVIFFPSHSFASLVTSLAISFGKSPGIMFKNHLDIFLLTLDELKLRFL